MMKWLKTVFQRRPEPAPFLPPAPETGSGVKPIIRSADGLMVVDFEARKITVRYPR
jgi:hypothetical protein